MQKMNESRRKRSEEFENLRETTSCSNYSIDGRFLIATRSSSIIIRDLFHSKKRELHVDITSAEIENYVFGRKAPVQIKNVFALDLSTVLLMFCCNGYQAVRLGVGNIDFEGSSISVKQAVSVSTDFWTKGCSWMSSKSYPPNLYDGLVLQMFLWKWMPSGVLTALFMD
ncbi:hypothetical protein M3Y96_00403600 [Aphelenchoides besseyi]|nr:hypothetical protein M3Y96_00403600 [Aphelenchoides besseyi]